MLNPMMVEGQVIGGAVEGIGSATPSEISYDSEAQPLNGMPADYLVITAAEAPGVHIQHFNSFSNPLGMHGVREGGLIPVPSAIANAISRVVDPKAIGPEIAFSKLPITPELGFQALARVRTSDLQPPPWQNEWPLR